MHDKQIIELLERILQRQDDQDVDIDTLKQNLHLANQQIRNVGLVELEILNILKSVPSSVTDFTLSQLKGATAMAINGTIAGAVSTFQIGFVPATNFIPLTAGPAVAVDDPSVTLSAVAADGTFTATTVATDTAASYNLTVTGTNDKGVALTHTFNVPFIVAPPVSVTDFSLNQVS